MSGSGTDLLKESCDLSEPIRVESGSSLYSVIAHSRIKGHFVATFLEKFSIVFTSAFQNGNCVLVVLSS